jgi:hypothetical protein
VKIVQWLDGDFEIRTRISSRNIFEMHRFLNKEGNISVLLFGQQFENLKL